MAARCSGAVGPRFRRRLLVGVTALAFAISVITERATSFVFSTPRTSFISPATSRGHGRQCRPVRLDRSAGRPVAADRVGRRPTAAFGMVVLSLLGVLTYEGSRARQPATSSA